MTEEELQMQLKRTLDREAALELAASIHRLGGRKPLSAVRQGWQLGFEFDLWWQIIHEGYRHRDCEKIWTARDVEHYEIADLALLATRAGGWWVWDQGLQSERFIPMHEWLPLYRSVCDVSR